MVRNLRIFQGQSSLPRPPSSGSLTPWEWYLTPCSLSFPPLLLFFHWNPDFVLWYHLCLSPHPCQFTLLNFEQSPYLSLSAGYISGLDVVTYSPNEEEFFGSCLYSHMNNDMFACLASLCIYVYVCMLFVYLFACFVFYVCMNVCAYPRVCLSHSVADYLAARQADRAGRTLYLEGLREKGTSHGTVPLATVSKCL